MANWVANDILKLKIIYNLTSKKIIETVQKFPSFEKFSKSSETNQLFQENLDERWQKFYDFVDFGGFYITYFDEKYPFLLKHISDPPAILFVKGNDDLNVDCISIVGTRKCSHYGRYSAEYFAKEFVSNGITIVSGMAYGIDAVAHNSTIDNGGKTIAVLAGGLDCISPSNAVKLSQKILDNGGTLLTTHLPGTNPLPQFFLQRNRIISGLSKAVLIIESKLKGGALWTAKFASDQNKEVFALPGNINSETSKGCNKLIKDSIAQIALSPLDVLQELGMNKVGVQNNNNLEKVLKNDNEKAIYNALGSEPLHIDSLFDSTGLDMSEILVSLLNLEFDNHIKQLPGKYYIRAN